MGSSHDSIRGHPGHGNKIEEVESIPPGHTTRSRRNRHSIIVWALLAAGITAWTHVFGLPAYMTPNGKGSTVNDISSSCDTIDSGYQCSPKISRFWGQYSPYFNVPSAISGDVPSGCEITFAQVLSRHGGRDPTKHKSALYDSTITRIQKSVKEYTGLYKFLANYKYSLGEDQLTLFGERQMVNSGVKYYRRYEHLAKRVTPFVRSSSQHRVLVSAQKWAQGFHHAKLADEANRSGDPTYPYGILIIPEAKNFNNSLSHDLCKNFNTGPSRHIGSHAMKTWANIFVPPIQARINRDLHGADLNLADVIVLMDLCPYETIASPNGSTSPFCSLFTEQEWHQYDYYQSLGKYYGYGNGNPLGPVQGFGFANELIARLTDQPVNDHTSTNRTLDRDPRTFPLGSRLYADFTHDNDMTMIFSALGLYHGTNPLPNSTELEAPETGGYSAAWTVPFAARAYFEKMRCHDHDEELVRVLVNDRVVPLELCGSDHLGRCPLSTFVDSLAYTSKRDEWDKCFE